MKYLIIVDYDRDSERKRIDYLIEKWRNKGKIEKIKKMAILAELEDIEEFLNEILARLEREDELKVYKVEEINNKISPRKMILSYKLKDKKALESFVDYLMAKLKASYELTLGNVKKYTAYSKMGNVSILVKVDNEKVIFELEGYGEGVEKIKERIDKDMKLFLGEKDEFVL
ncbi:conserved hypothetical protein [Methanocaldococcus infernus ME]|uniref:Uncharacterized protein n=1 Tax=Methanocaldococcus infernus (strain DSM 11812 / JCM 15783 / ME) TaxID=573063 RepID=D5VRF6_METIM|nr:hypothetical protein [Methanocaldococcus infernus]ADG13159.1 conserved hypothetical protein [Methanocaldococcus infernus ME]